jgi:hypothetical protein
VTHMLSLHTWPARHSTRHPPQLARSLEVSTHSPKQNIWPAGYCRACAFTEGWVRHRSRPRQRANKGAQKDIFSRATARSACRWGYRHGFFQSSSVSRFTAGAAGFFIEPLRERRLQNVRAPVTCVLGCSLCEPPNTRTVAHVECARSTPPAIEPHPSRTIPASLFASAAQWAPLLRSRITRSMPFTTRATFSVSILSGMSLGR